MIATPLHRKKREAKAAKARGAKWDWDIILTLYLSGLNPSDIVKLPDFKALSKKYLEQRIYKEGWSARRQRFLASSIGHGCKNLQERIKQAINSHYSFIVEEFEQEREIYRSRPKNRDIQSQRERLEVLEKIANMAYKQLGLGEQKPGDVAQIGYGAMIQVNVNTSRNGRNPQSAIIPLPLKQNATTGILTSGNGIPITVRTAEIAEETGTGEIEPLPVRIKKPNLSEKRKAAIVREVTRHKRDEVGRRDERKAKRAVRRKTARVKLVE